MGLLVSSRHVDNVEDHFHNYERVFGAAAVPSGTHFGDVESLTTYQATSGNNAFGTDANDEAQVLGQDDTPASPGSLLFDLRDIQVVDVSNATVFLLRVIHGSGSMAEAEGAGEFSEFTSIQVAAPNGQAKPVNIITSRIPVGQKVWIRAKNGTDNAWIDFLVGVHEYPVPAARRSYKDIATRFRLTL